MVKYFYGQKSRKQNTRKRRLRTECNIANMATRDKWYTEKAKEIDLPQYEIISKEKVLEEIELIKKLEANLKNI